MLDQQPDDMCLLMVRQLRETDLLLALYRMPDDDCRRMLDRMMNG
jgi:hypothetical protein